MKKTAIAVAVAVAAFATVAQAAPKDNTWYTGAKLGWSNYQGTANHFEGTSIGNGPTHRSDVGAGAFAGYQYNQYMGFELGYDWLGRMAYKGSVDNGAFRAQGIQLTTKLSYPVMEDLDVYTRLGAMVWRADSSATINTGKVGQTSRSDNDTGVSPVFALGTEYALTQDIAARVEYQWINNIGDKETLGARPDNGMLSVGVAYRFGQETAPVIAPAPVVEPVAPVVENKRFTLRSDVLFNFNKSTLKAEGQEALNQLFTELAAIDPTQGHVVVIGFTDRIGSQNYNLPLSQKRAQSVVDYLVAKGIPAGSITAEGRGKENPVTGNTCDNVTKRAALIDCLAPDRRVEIEIQGVAEEVVPAAAVQ